jgi:hypothetical protein
MFNKLSHFVDLFRTGTEMTHAIAMKKGQLTANMIAAFLAAVVGTAKVYGHDIPLSDETLLAIGTSVIGVLGLFNTGATVASTTKVGILPAKPDEPDSASDPVPTVLQPTAATVQPVNKSSDADVLAGLDTTYIG